ncbi:MAG: MBL fold metallo-hydrolase [Aeoliella sp.]
MLRSIALLFFLLLAAPASRADPGKPVAVRWWGQGMVSIETYWNQTVVIDPYNDNIGYTVPDIDGDLVLVTHEHSDHNNVKAVGGEPEIIRGLSPDGQARAIDGVFDRMPNNAKPMWYERSSATNVSGHAIKVTSIPSWHDDEQGAKRGANAMFVIDVDGMRIVHCGDLGQNELSAVQVKAMGKVDVLCIPVGGVYTIDGNQAAAIIDQVEPRIVVPIHYKTDTLTIDLHNLDPFIDAIGDEKTVERVDGNTLAVAAADDGATARVVVLGYESWQPDGELAELLDKMDAACQASQQVFSPLSANQLNWSPPNGTHTPRWNAEHMMGRQLGFFSQIYAAIDPTFKPIDLNPKQMPPDYKAAHPDWDGTEEARQMERANAFVRRFAYLLDGVDLDAQAPGSRWKLRGLLKQMDRHFGEHTANVQKKFELDEWPRE